MNYVSILNCSAFPSSMMKSQASLPGNESSPRPLHPCPLVTQQPSRVSERPPQHLSACVQVPLFHLIMVPKHKSGEAGNLDTPKRSCKMIPLSEKVNTYNKIF